jgi:hypothetical protein
MEIIQGRLKEIQEYYDEKASEMQIPQPAGKIRKPKKEEKKDWKTMSIDY